MTRLRQYQKIGKQKELNQLDLPKSNSETNETDQFDEEKQDLKLNDPIHFE